MSVIYQEDRYCNTCEEITTHDIDFDMDAGCNLATCIECGECFPIDYEDEEPYLFDEDLDIGTGD